nr:hypothetical protein [Paenibacillus sp. BJ-4]
MNRLKLRLLVMINFIFQYAKGGKCLFVDKVNLIDNDPIFNGLVISLQDGLPILHEEINQFRACPTAILLNQI